MENTTTLNRWRLILGEEAEDTLSSMGGTELSAEELLMDSERDRMTRTAHNKIFVAPPIPIEEDAFENQLGRLKEAAAENDNERVVETLVEIVGTYTPNRDMLAS